jgi:NADPH:quinone reductase-like Zn-dependent oxidoreductase
MKSWWIKNSGDHVALELRDVPMPQPARGEMRVRMKAASINRGDMLARIQRHSAADGRPAGVDGAGEVCAVGESVMEFKPGERVMFRAQGCFAEYAMVDPALAARVPDHLTWEEAAAIPVAFITAYEALVQFGHLQAGETVLIAGASSGVGVAALQTAKALGAWVIGVSGSAEKLARLKTLGLDAAVCTHGVRGGGFADDVLWVTRKRGVDLAVNLVGGSAFADCQRALADFGRQVVVGYVDGQMKAEIDLEALHGKRLHVMGISNAPLTSAQRAEAMRGFMDLIYPAFASGKIQPVIDRVFDFDALPAAKAYVDTNQLLGKVIIRLPMP